MEPKLEIRSAAPEDLEGLERVFRSHKPSYDWKYARRYFRSFFGHPEQHPQEVVLVGVVEGRVIGVIGYLPDRSEADDVFWLGWFYVHKDERGNQYGKKLLDQVIREVKEKRGRKLFTDTSSWGFYGRAHHRYQEYGFKEEAKLEDYYGKGEHQVIYGMSLS